MPYSSGKGGVGGIVPGVDFVLGVDLVPGVDLVHADDYFLDVSDLRLSLEIEIEIAMIPWSFPDICVPGP